MAIGVYCLDVGQGQCIALIGPSSDGYEASLIDVGPMGSGSPAGSRISAFNGFRWSS